jgi:hypothetical protein
VEAYLHTLHNSSIIGDVNVRFRNSFFQEGTAGLTDRLNVFTKWLNNTGKNQVLSLTDICTDVKPIISHESGLRPKLNFDHCFVSQRHSTKASLRLLDSTQISLRTDHRYVIHLTVAAQR